MGSSGPAKLELSLVHAHQLLINTTTTISFATRLLPLHTCHPTITHLHALISMTPASSVFFHRGTTRLQNYPANSSFHLLLPTLCSCQSILTPLHILLPNTAIAMSTQIITTCRKSATTRKTTRPCQLRRGAAQQPARGSQLLHHRHPRPLCFCRSQITR